MILLITIPWLTGHAVCARTRTASTSKWAPTCALSPSGMISQSPSFLFIATTSLKQKFNLWQNFHRSWFVWKHPICVARHGESLQRPFTSTMTHHTMHEDDEEHTYEMGRRGANRTSSKATALFLEKQSRQHQSMLKVMPGGGVFDITYLIFKWDDGKGVTLSRSKDPKYRKSGLKKVIRYWPKIILPWLLFIISFMYCGKDELNKRMLAWKKVVIDGSAYFESTGTVAPCNWFAQYPRYWCHSASASRQGSIHVVKGPLIGGEALHGKI